jgi:hypothetical protein
MLAAPLLAAQDKAVDMPSVRAARIETRTVAESLQKTLREIVEGATNPVWIGYGVAGVDHDRINYLSGYSAAWLCGRRCPLEEANYPFALKGGGRPIANLEETYTLIVLFRAEGRRVVRVQTSSDECVLNAGGTTFVWLTGVSSQESVELLKQYLSEIDLTKSDAVILSGSVLRAIALHADAAADRALESFVTQDQKEALREAAVPWLGERGKAGLAVLENMAKTDPSVTVRQQVASTFSASSEPEALDALIRMSREDPSTEVRGQTFSWLAQRAEERAISAIAAAVENDPDIEVKNQALYALSQLPKEQSVPRLIEVVKRNRNREIRKQAILLLSESGDRRALAFFERMLLQ